MRALPRLSTCPNTRIQAILPVGVTEAAPNNLLCMLDYGDHVMKYRRITPPTAPRKSGEDHPTINQAQSEWARIPAACAISTVSRSTLYANFDTAGGAIKTASIRKRGATRGIRMVSVPSLLAWLDSYAQTPAAL